MASSAKNNDLNEQNQSTQLSNIEVENDYETSVACLKRRKAVLKSAFTRSKNALERLIDEVGLPSRGDVRDAIDKVDQCQIDAIEIIASLSEVYQTNGDKVNMVKTCKELEDLERVGTEAQERAQQYLVNRSVSSAVLTSPDPESLPRKSPLPNREKTHLPPLSFPNEIEQPILTPIRSRDQNDYTLRAHDTEEKFKDMHIGHKQISDETNISNDMSKHLKRVTIPTFSGEIRTYESWKAAFLACVDRSSASPEYKLLQLRQYVTGEAKRAIENLGHSASAYEVALERLERKYGGKRRHIASQLEQVSSFKPIRPGHASDIERFADMLDVVVVNLRDSDKVEELGNGALYCQLLKKMTEDMVTNYQRWLFDYHRQESVVTLREWVLQEAEFQVIACESIHGLVGRSKNIGRKMSEKQGTYFTKKHCPICNMDNHDIAACRKFTSMSVPRRWYLAKKLKLCFTCLGQTHFGKQCSQTKRCGIENCSSLHNPLLHSTCKHTTPTTPSSSTQGDSHVEGKASDTVTMSSNKFERSSLVSLRTVPVVVKKGQKKVIINALLDDASTQTYINEDISAQLGLVGEPESVSVNVLNGQSSSFKSMTVDFGLESLDGSVDIQLSALTTKKVTGRMQVVDWQKHGKRWRHLHNVPFPKVQKPHTIDLLIGMDYLELHRSFEDIVGDENEPIARLTPLGWTCVGRVPSHQSFTTSESGTYHSCTDSDLNSLLHKFWQIDDVPSPPSLLTHDEESIVEMVSKTLVKDSDRYQVGIPWKHEPKELPSNYDMALKRLVSTEKKLSKDESVADKYSAIVSDYLKKDYIHEVSEIHDGEDGWYLPHFPVVRPDRSTTKVRIVFDASAKCQGVSLNDVIHQGPKLQGDLFQILLRFRHYPVALVCDIAEMYLQIEIKPNDRPYFRFLWRSLNLLAKLTVYEFNRLVFGMNASPFLAQFVSQENARRSTKSIHNLQAAIDTVLKSTYMDDSLDSGRDDSEGIELYRQLSTLWSMAGMKARKWISNSPKVLEQIPSEDRASEVNLAQNELPSTKTLGVVWRASEDEFAFRSSTPESVLLTKRNFLKELARLFDPLGFVSPFSILGKVIMQKFWLSGVGWDDPIYDPVIIKQAEQWLSEFSDLDMVRVPRCLILHGVQDHRLHVFVDASQDAYGAVVYSKLENDTAVSRLVTSKSKVCPLKTVSVPRLELMAAVLGVKLLTSVTAALEMNIETAILWSDSMNVLHWLRNQSRIFKSFVANRVSFIQEHTEPRQWQYVPTALNAADILSRGSRLSDLAQDKWVCGPSYLLLEKGEWPDQPELLSSNLSEVKKTSSSVVTLVTQMEPLKLLDTSKYSDWKRFTRILAWVLRFVHNVSLSADKRNSGELTVDEITDADTLAIREAQRSSFPDEAKLLQRKTLVPVKSKLKDLNPFIDVDGVIRSGGRLQNADFLPYNAQFPVILPRRSRLTTLIIKKCHEDGKHILGTNQILARLSSKYWIIAAREAIREWEKECSVCRIRKAKPVPQIMSQLPRSRLKHSMRAFDTAAVDFAGPFLTVQGRGKQRVKRYLCLFTCLSTRAVHLEMAFGLDSDSFLQAFYRMTCRRGLPSEMLSDNGTNFVGAVKELKQLVSLLDSDVVHSSLANRGVRWKFNPPYAPHFGGVFESMIKSAKKAIYAILSSGDVTDEELMTAFAGAESLINSRPLTYQSTNTHDDVPLSPNHFLHGQLGGSFAPETVDTTAFDPRKRWRRVQELLRHFWKRWIREWLPSLQASKKWFSPSRDLQAGDVVLLLSPDAQRGTWKLGRVLKTYPGQDGHVRVVDVKSGGAVLTRPVTRICPLEWNSGQELKDAMEPNQRTSEG